MKKIQFLFLIILVSHLCNAQDVLLQVAKNYFRSSPFEHEFSQFLNHLMKDPTLINPTVNKRTDSNLFYLKGDYKTHNPFFFKAKLTHVVLAEQELLINDSLQLVDTIIIYQLAGYSEAGKEGEEDVKKEFERFDNKYIKKFGSNDYKELKNGNEIVGAIRNYFTKFSFLSPLSVAWQKIIATNENVFVITLRFKVSGNIAILPISADSP